MTVLSRKKAKALANYNKKFPFPVFSCIQVGFGKTCPRYGNQGWRSVESTCLPPMWPGFNFRRWRHMWVEFVVRSRPYSEGFSPGTPVYHTPQKPTLTNSDSALEGHPNRPFSKMAATDLNESKLNWMKTWYQHWKEHLHFSNLAKF